MNEEIPCLTDEMHSQHAQLYRDFLKRLQKVIMNFLMSLCSKLIMLKNHSVPWQIYLTPYAMHIFFAISNNNFINVNDLAKQQTYLALLSDCLYLNGDYLVNLDLPSLDRLKPILLAMAKPENRWSTCFATKKYSLIFNNSLLTLSYLYEDNQQLDQANLCRTTATHLETQFGFNPRPLKLEMKQAEEERNQFNLENERKCYATVIFEACEKATLFFEKSVDFNKIIQYIKQAYQKLGETYQFSPLQQALCAQISSLLAIKTNFNFNDFFSCLSSLFDLPSDLIRKIIHYCALDTFLRFLCACLDSDCAALNALHLTVTNDNLDTIEDIKKQLSLIKQKFEKFCSHQASLASLTSTFLEQNHHLFTTHILELQKRIASLEENNALFNKQLHAIIKISGLKRKGVVHGHVNTAGILFSTEKNRVNQSRKE